MKTKKLYMKPVIERAVVELEGGFCGSIDAQHDPEVRTAGQETYSATDEQLNQWNATDWE